MRLFQLVYMVILFIDELSIRSGCVVIDLHDLSCIFFEDIKLYLKKKKKKVQKYNINKASKEQMRSWKQDL